MGARTMPVMTTSTAAPSAAIDDEELSRLRALCEKATPGPWVSGFAMSEGPTEMVSGWTKGGHAEPCDEGETTLLAKQQADMDFIATARTALPGTLEEIERLRQVNDVLEARDASFARYVADLRAEVEAMRLVVENLRAEIERTRFDERDSEDARRRGLNATIADLVVDLRQVTAERDALRAEVDAAWAATGVASAVRGLTTLEDVVANHRQDLVTLRGLLQRTRYYVVECRRRTTMTGGANDLIADIDTALGPETK